VDGECLPEALGYARGFHVELVDCSIRTSNMTSDLPGVKYWTILRTRVRFARMAKMAR